LRLRVRLMIDGEPYGEQAADRLRPDLRLAGIGDGAHAFAIMLPDGLADGRAHSISVVEAESGQHLAGSPRLIDSYAVGEAAAEEIPSPRRGRQESDDAAVAPILFVHVPKTAGMTIRTILEYQYSVGEILEIVEGEHLEQICRAGIPNHVRLVSGHIPPFVRDLFAVPPRLLTIVRDPLERIASAYRYWQTYEVTEESKKKFPHVALAHRLSMDDFFMSDDPCLVPDLENYHARYLGNIDAARRFNLDELLRNAKEVLDSAIWVGVVERMPLSLALLSRALSLPPQPYEMRVNVTSPKYGAGSVSTLARSRARERNSHDYALYEHACNLLDAQARAAITTHYSLGKLRNESPPVRAERRCRFTMDNGMIGAGWWERGKSRGVAFRSASRGQPVSLYFWWPVAGEALLCFWFPSVRNDCVALSIAINGSRIRLRLLPCRAGFVGVAAVPDSLIDDDEMVELSFQTAESARTHGNAESADTDDRFSPTALTSFSLAEIQWFDAGDLTSGLPAGLNGFLARMRVASEDTAALHLALAADMGPHRANDVVTAGRYAQGQQSARDSR
jgi:hypothetical protein